MSDPALNFSEHPLALAPATPWRWNRRLGLLCAVIGVLLLAGYPWFYDNYLNASPLNQQIRQLRLQILLHPSDVDLRLRLAGLHEAKGDFRAARRLLTRTLAIAPEEPSVHYLLGVVSLQARDYRRAEAAFRQTAAIQPDFGPAWFGLGKAYTGLGRKNEAVRAYTEATRTLPGSPLAWTGLAQARVAVGQTAEAAEARETARKLRQRREAERLLGQQGHD